MLLVHLLVIAMLPLWWWTWWRVEGILIHLFHLILLIMVVLTSVVGKLVLSIAGAPVSKASTRSMIPAMDCCTLSRVMSVDCYFFVKSSVIAFIMAQTSL
jgi:hypothetical protein